MRNHEKLSDKKSANPWNDINWEEAEEYVNRLQLRIVKAVQKNKWNLIKRLQYLLIHSFYAKALAVKRVTTNKGKRTAGVDGELWQTPAKKSEAIYNLNEKGYSAQPLRRVYIEKYGKKEKRPLSIPTMKDRAMQALFLMSLEPIAETTADRISFGFRKYRSAHDAMAYLFMILAKRTAPIWILEGDIKGCFDNISHNHLLNNIPMNKRVLRKFIKSGYVFRKKLFPTKAGTPQGGIISPTLANMTLDGMEKTLIEEFWTNQKGQVKDWPRKKNKVNLIRYADDFVVTDKTKEIAEKAKEIIQSFLIARGLTLSAEKTKITNIHDGFDFLGWNFRKYNKKLIIKASDKSVKKVNKTISITIKGNASSTQGKLILKLNQIITGWANYHQPVCSKKTFSKLDSVIWNMLWKWSKRRHPNKNHNWVMHRYWRKVKTRKWVFAENGLTLRKAADIPIVRHIALQLNRNPFLDKDYFENRKQTQQNHRKMAYLKSTAAHIFGCGL